jgi:hypothetical protein
MNRGIPCKDLKNKEEIIHQVNKYYCGPELTFIEYCNEYYKHRLMLTFIAATRFRELQLQAEQLNRVIKYNKPNIILYSEPPQSTEQIFDCCICYESCNNLNIIKLKCNHELCKDCCIKVIDKTKSYNNCPLCREPITELKVNNSIVENEMNAEFVN